jgi:hypothetical protein
MIIGQTLYRKKTERHGMYNSPTYTSWRAMKDRIRTKDKRVSQHYEDKGIGVFKDWHISFISFFNSMGERPAGKSIDRISSENGYCPHNCKWSTNDEQILNRFIPVLNETRKFRGVYKQSKGNKFYASIRFNKKDIFLGNFFTQEEAYEVYKAKYLELRGVLP